MMVLMRKRLTVLASLSALSVLIVWAQEKVAPIPLGHTALNVVGRLRFDASRQGELFGYLSFAERLGVAPFSGDPSEKTAYFTYRTEPFTLDIWRNGLMLHGRPVPVRGSNVVYRIYYNASPNADFDKPESFSAGLPVVTLRARGVQLDAVPLGAANASGTLEVVSSTPFDFQGRLINLADLAKAVSIQLRGGPTPAGRSSAAVLDFSYGGTGVVAAPSSEN
jgi:hypothetical protein